MDSLDFFGLFFLLLAVLGWVKAYDRAFAIKEVDIARAWQHRRYLRPTGEPRVWRLP